MNKSDSNRMIKQVEAHINCCFPDYKKLSIVLGVSGGPDSMSLLYIFSRLGIDVTVVHCNYQLRGDDSDKDQKLVEDTASMWGFDAISVRLDPSDAKGENFQKWARDKRYQVFRDLKSETGADAIATAHHQDDQLETIIQKILRGAGMTAWQGMQIWNDDLFRPLLGFSKARILQFASGNHIPYRLDSSNEESTYARNFLRNGWFPILDDLFPGWRENILKVPDRAREHEALSNALISSLLTDDNDILRDRLISFEPEVQKPILLQVLKSIDQDIQISTGALENLDKLETLQTGKKLQVNDRWNLIRDRDRFIVSEDASPEIPEVIVMRDDLRKIPKNIHNYLLEKKTWEGDIDTSVLQLDADKLVWPLSFRIWKDGDEINPFGMDGSQKISDLLTNNKISAAKKSSSFVCESFDGKICAVIFPQISDKGKTGTIADWARCTPETETMLVIRQSD